MKNDIFAHFLSALYHASRPHVGASLANLGIPESLILYKYLKLKLNNFDTGKVISVEEIFLMKFVFWMFN